MIEIQRRGIESVRSEKDTLRKAVEQMKHDMVFAELEGAFLTDLKFRQCSFQRC